LLLGFNPTVSILGERKRSELLCASIQLRVLQWGYSVHVNHLVLHEDEVLLFPADLSRQLISDMLQDVLQVIDQPGHVLLDALLHLERGNVIRRYQDMRSWLHDVFPAQHLQA
jgi:hypothetical protein